jgi:hypothetical protein
MKETRREKRSRVGHVCGFARAERDCLILDSRLTVRLASRPLRSDADQPPRTEGKGVPPSAAHGLSPREGGLPPTNRSPARGWYRRPSERRNERNPTPRRRLRPRRDRCRNRSTARRSREGQPCSSTRAEGVAQGVRHRPSPRPRRRRLDRGHDARTEGIRTGLRGKTHRQGSEAHGRTASTPGVGLSASARRHPTDPRLTQALKTTLEAGVPGDLLPAR